MIAKTAYISPQTTLGEHCNIGEYVCLLGTCIIGKNVTIEPFSMIRDSVIGDNSTIISSDITSANIGAHNTVGPYARIRPHTITKDHVKIGNFVEIKNSTLASGVKVSHLAYVGDATIGKNTNIGCGVIFANYNGKEKHKTVVGDHCFIGSNANIIAPVTLANHTYICAGTTVTDNSKEHDFVIGRSRATTKSNYAQKYWEES